MTTSTDTVCIVTATAVHPGLTNTNAGDLCRVDSQRVGVEDDEVRTFADSERTELVFPTQRGRAFQGMGPQRLTSGDPQVVGAEFGTAPRHPSNCGLDRLERSGFGNGGIGGDSGGYTCGEEFAEGVEPLSRRADGLFDALAPVVVVLCLVDWPDAEFGHPGDVCLSRESAVLDPMPGIGVRPLTHGPFNGVDDHGDGGRRLSVRRGLQSVRMSS